MALNQCKCHTILLYTIILLLLYYRYTIIVLYNHYYTIHYLYYRYKLMQVCWETSPSERLHFAQTVEYLAHYLEHVNNKRDSYYSDEENEGGEREGGGGDGEGEFTRKPSKPSRTSSVRSGSLVVNCIVNQVSHPSLSLLYINIMWYHVIVTWLRCHVFLSRILHSYKTISMSILVSCNIMLLSHDIFFFCLIV